MKNLLSVFLCLFAQVLFANSFSDYKNHIANDKLIVIFESNITTAQKADLLNKSGLITSFTNLPAPAITICFTNNFNGAVSYLQNTTGVKFVSFFIVDENGNFGGVLNDFFVKIKDSNFENMLDEKLKGFGISAITKDKYIPNLYHVWNIKATTKNTVDLCAEMQHEAWVEYASPNYLLSPKVNSNDTYYNRQWNIHNTGSAVQGHGVAGADMKVDSAWDITTGDPSIKISVIDAGVDTLHPDLQANLLHGHDAIDDSFSTDGYPTPNYAEDGHGTCCAGIIAAVKDNSLDIAGVAPSCKIIPVHVFYYYVISAGSDPVPLSTAAAFADAIGWSWDTAQADILSNSWALPSSLIALLPGGEQPVDDAIAQAWLHGRGGKGTAMFFSSGNSEDSTGALWPGTLWQTISVGATNMCDFRKSPTDCSGENWGSNYGVNLDFGAPGVRIATTDMLGNKGFSNTEYTFTFNGTSAACPNAAGVGALVLSLRPDFKAEDVRNVIAQTCDKVGGYAYDSLYGDGTWCKQLGYGRVNAFRAVQLAPVFTAVNEVKETKIELNVWPNPTNSTITINYTGEQKTQAGLYDLTGKLCQRFELQNGINTHDVSAQPGGIYLLKVEGKTDIATRKVAICR